MRFLLDTHAWVWAVLGDSRLGRSARKALASLGPGERDPARLAAHRDPRCRKSVAEIARYLTGTWRDEHLFTLASALRSYVGSVGAARQQSEWAASGSDSEGYNFGPSSGLCSYALRNTRSAGGR